jgi:hypothetical protein
MTSLTDLLQNADILKLVLEHQSAEEDMVSKHVNIHTLVINHDRLLSIRVIHGMPCVDTCV